MKQHNKDLINKNLKVAWILIVTFFFIYGFISLWNDLNKWEWKDYDAQRVEFCEKFNLTYNFRQYRYGDYCLEIQDDVIVLAYEIEEVNDKLYLVK